MINPVISHKTRPTMAYVEILREPNSAENTKPLAANGPADVSIIGLGYVGLPLSAILASKGLHVAGVDIRNDVIDSVNNGKSTIVEPYLDEMVETGAREGFLHASLRPVPAHVFIIAVPTPIDKDKKAEMTAVFSAVRSIAPLLQPRNLVVIECTSPVGTTDKASRLLAGLHPDLSFPHDTPENSDILLAYCPERVLPGDAIRELIENSRTTGGIDKRSALAAKAFYSKFVTGELRITDARSAELSKLAENSFRDVNIAFANELSMLCDAYDMDVREVIQIANLHPRVNILSPGAGVGGHCIPVDPWFIHEMAPELTPLIRTAREVNDRKPLHVVKQITDAAQGNRDCKIALLGLAYKPNVDDMRESPAIEVAAELSHFGYRNIMAVEPHAHELPRALLNADGVALTPLDEAIGKADVIAILVPHDAFAPLRRKQLGAALIDPVAFLRK